MNKKRIYILSLSIIILAGIFLLLNINVSTKQGINYELRTIRIPVYLKILNFFDRHYNYKELTKKIIDGSKTEQEHAEKIFIWTYKNLKRVPPGYPIIDDHVWHIIVRGYGTNDQFSDVFTTLCNYAGIDAFFLWIYAKDNKIRPIPLSFVRLEKRWHVFDPYQGAYFKDKEGNFIDVGIIKQGSWVIEMLGDRTDEIDYSVYLGNLPEISKIGLTRANIQSPLKRLFFEFKKVVKCRTN